MEDDTYIIEVEKPVWVEGTKHSKPFRYKCNRADLRQAIMEKNRLGYKHFEILHDPDPEYTAKVKAEIEAMGERRTKRGLAGTGSKTTIS